MTRVRAAEDADMAAVARIYAAHVQTGLGTFEETAPSPQEMMERRTVVLDHGLPYLVAELDGAVVGYAYASAFRMRSGYQFTAEDSVYVAPEAIGKGVGRALLDALIQRCEALGLRQLVALIGDSANDASIALHRKAGFQTCGVMRSVGYKHDRWVDVVLMQRVLAGGDLSPPSAVCVNQALA